MSIKSPKEWKRTKLGKILPRPYKNGIYKSADYYGSGISILRINDFDNRGNLTSPELQKVYLNENEISNYRLNIKDIVVNRVNSLTHLGKSILWNESKITTVYESNMMCINPDEEIIKPEFLIHVLHHEPSRNFFRRVAKRAVAQSSINQQDVKALPLLLPPLPEQKAIAALLSTWDEAIEITERLIQAKERRKLGELHSRISSQKANSAIGSFAKSAIRKVDKPNESYVALGIRSHFKGTFQRPIEHPRTIDMDSLYRVKENDLIVNITFAWKGAIALVKKEDEECFVSHRFPTYEIKKSKAVPSFIRQLIMSSRMKYDLSNISPGGAGRNRVLNKKDFLKMPIWLPDLKTQKNIGEYLGAIDREIDLLKQLADKYKTQKRGLMQKMLSGEWRVKPEVVSRYEKA
jgi:type I restriction enzyme, S subunit